MEIHRPDRETVALTDIDLFLCELLQQILVSADPAGNQAAEQRLYSSPTHGRDTGFDAEWEEYVEPELREQFQSALDIVRQDLSGLSCDVSSMRPCTLTVPVAHMESWINALNQARLTLAAKHNVTEADMDSMPVGGDTRALAIFQIHFYGYIQERFLRVMES